MSNKCQINHKKSFLKESLFEFLVIFVFTENQTHITYNLIVI
jgi:hypothetical protein